ncbi:hypothetical protein [Blautia sp. MCC283]|uniref:defense against restriction DarA-related protein n=1 Tax=Blautia sp. MCC283 TaxID=2592640 RepID=UPI001C0385CA|nr:hypothetical protein [Blautia sp. MCC283]
MRYYSTQRPVTLGSYPCKDSVIEIHNFDNRTFCEEIGAESWGYIEYNCELSEKEAAEYELVPEGLKTFWAVTTSFYDDGRVTAYVADKKQAAAKPENTSKILPGRDVYTDWFASYKEAREFVNEAINC